MRANNSNCDDWIRRAENDWKTIDKVTATPADLWEVAAFHAQQCAEKYLKAFLVRSGWQLKKTHDLIELLADALAYDSTLSVLTPECQELNPLIISGRYPVAWVNEQQCRSAITAAGRIRTEIRKRMNYQ